MDIEKVLNSKRIILLQNIANQGKVKRSMAKLSRDAFESLSSGLSVLKDFIQLGLVTCDKKGRCWEVIITNKGVEVLSIVKELENYLR